MGNVRELSNKTMLEKLVIASVFLMPILSLSVRHWLSGFFTLLFLFSLVFIAKNKSSLYKEEKTLLLIILFFLASFFLSATINDWSSMSFRRIGNELKYLTFIPMYFCLRSDKNLLNYFLYGIILGAIILGVQSIYDVITLNATNAASLARGEGLAVGIVQARGIYGPIIFGDLAVLFFCFIFVKFKSIKKSKLIYVSFFIALVFATVAIYLSASRNAWLAFLISIFILPFLFSKRPLRLSLFTTLGSILIIVSMIQFFPASIYQRASLAVDEFENYMNPEENDSTRIIKESSIGFRLEQWRVALLLIKEKPIFGFGAGNAGRGVNDYSQMGLAHKDVFNPKAYTGISGLHSMYFDSLVNEGILGFLIMLLLFLYPLYLFVRYRKEDTMVSTLGILFIVNFMIFGISENPLVHDNFTSVFLATLAILFSSMIRAKYMSTK